MHDNANISRTTAVVLKRINEIELRDKWSDQKRSR